MNEKIEKIIFKIKSYPLFAKVFNFSKEKLFKIRDVISESFDKCKIGEENLKTLLWGWCIVPNILIKFFLFDLLKMTLVNLIYIVYNLMCLYFILKAVKVHPEYNKLKMEEMKEAEYVKSLGEEELKLYKKEKIKQGSKDFVKKALLQKPWKRTEGYKVVILILVLLITISVRNLFI